MRRIGSKKDQQFDRLPPGTNSTMQSSKEFDADGSISTQSRPNSKRLRNKYERKWSSSAAGGSTASASKDKFGKPVLGDPDDAAIAKMIYNTTDEPNKENASPNSMARPGTSQGGPSTREDRSPEAGKKISNDGSTFHANAFSSNTTRGPGPTGPPTGSQRYIEPADWTKGWAAGSADITNLSPEQSNWNNQSELKNKNSLSPESKKNKGANTSIMRRDAPLRRCPKQEEHYRKHFEGKKAKLQTTYVDKRIDVLSPAELSRTKKNAGGSSSNSNQGGTSSSASSAGGGAAGRLDALISTVREDSIRTNLSEEGDDVYAQYYASEQSGGGGTFSPPADKYHSSRMGLQSQQEYSRSGKNADGKGAKSSSRPQTTPERSRANEQAAHQNLSRSRKISGGDSQQDHTSTSRNDEDTGLTTTLVKTSTRVSAFGDVTMLSTPSKEVGYVSPFAGDQTLYGYIPPGSTHSGNSRSASLRKTSREQRPATTPSPTKVKRPVQPGGVRKQDPKKNVAKIRVVPPGGRADFEGTHMDSKQGLSKPTTSASSNKPGSSMGYTSQPSTSSKPGSRASANKSSSRSLHTPSSAGGATNNNRAQIGGSSSSTQGAPGRDKNMKAGASTRKSAPAGVGSLHASPQDSGHGGSPKSRGGSSSFASPSGVAGGDVSSPSHVVLLGDIQSDMIATVSKKGSPDVESKKSASPQDGTRHTVGGTAVGGSTNSATSSNSRGQPSREDRNFAGVSASSPSGRIQAPNNDNIRSGPFGGTATASPGDDVYNMKKPSTAPGVPASSSRPGGAFQDSGAP